jgi:hypothetical protein
VNGTFESVTGQVASLGFDSPVLNALANAPIVSEGLYGTPPYELSSSPSGGVWGEFWNAVSAVVTNPLGAVLAIVGEEWTLTLAVDTFVDHIAIEAAKIDGKLLTMEAAAIVHAGQLIANAMEAFLDWVWKQIASYVEGAIDSLTSQFKQARAAWVSDNLAAANASLAAMNGTPGAPARAQSDFLGVLAVPVALDIAITVAVSVVVYIALPFEIGPGTLVDFILPLIVTALGASLSIGGGGGLLGTVGQFLGGGVGSTYAWLESASEWLWNATHPSLSSSAVTSFVAPRVPGDHWTFIALLLGGIGVVASQIAGYLLPAASGGNTYARLALTDAALGLAILAVLMVVTEWLFSIWAPSGPASTVAEAVFDVAALIFGAISILFGVEAESPKSSAGVPIPPAAAVLGLVGVGAGGAAEIFGGIDLYSLSQEG